jgi:hypothetical protein
MFLLLVWRGCYCWKRLTVCFILDEYWLKEINVERRKQDLGEVTPELFEKIIDRLEKEWFDLVGGLAHSTAGGHLDGSTNRA